MSKPETTFEKAMVGDRVYSPLFKSVNADDKTNLVIVSILLNGCKIEVKPDLVARYHPTTTFNLDGSCIEDGGQILFWANPIKEIPARPKRKVMKKGWIGINPEIHGSIDIAHTTCVYATADELNRSLTDTDNYQPREIEFEVEE